MSPNHLKLPSAKEAKEKAAKAVKQKDPRPAPYKGAQTPATTIRTVNLNKQLNKWFEKIKKRRHTTK